MTTLRLAVLLAILFVLASPGVAQLDDGRPVAIGTARARRAAVGGSASDYARAADLRRRARGTVLNERLEPIWLGDAAFVFRDAIAPDGWTWRRIDARTGERDDAFDHARVAAQLRAALAGEGAREINPGRLDLKLQASEAGLLAGVFNGDVFIEIDPATSHVRLLDELEGDQDPRLLEQVRTRRSSNGGADTAIRLLNDSSGSVRVHWLDG